MKTCSKCKIEYDLSFFYKDKSSKDGHRTNCKKCAQEYRDSVKEKSKEYRKDYWDKNKDEINRKLRDNYNPDKKKKYYLDNKSIILQTRKSHYEKNKEDKKSYQKEYQKKNKEKRNKYLYERRQNDEIFRLITNIRNLILNSFYELGFSKNSKTNEILGCDFEQLKNHLESKFEGWMNWENRGLYNGGLNYGWDIDHIEPISNAKTIEDLYRLNHYTNLQPLCSKINRDIKKNKIWQEVTTL
jgi:hypothetical protein